MFDSVNWSASVDCRRSSNPGFPRFISNDNRFVLLLNIKFKALFTAFTQVNGSSHVIHGRMWSKFSQSEWGSLCAFRCLNRLNAFVSVGLLISKEIRNRFPTFLKSLETKELLFPHSIRDRSGWRETSNYGCVQKRRGRPEHDELRALESRSRNHCGQGTFCLWQIVRA